MVEPESIAPSLACTARTTNNVVESVVLSKTRAPASCRWQHTHILVLVDRFADPLNVRVSSDSFTEWINGDNINEFLNCILRNWAFVATIEDTNPIHHDITLVGLVSQPACFIWLCGVGSLVQGRELLTADPQKKSASYLTASSVLDLECIYINQSWLLDGCHQTQTFNFWMMLKLLRPWGILRLDWMPSAFWDGHEPVRTGAYIMV